MERKVCAPFPFSLSFYPRYLRLVFFRSFDCPRVYPENGRRHIDRQSFPFTVTDYFPSLDRSSTSGSFLLVSPFNILSPGRSVRKMARFEIQGGAHWETRARTRGRETRAFYEIMAGGRRATSPAIDISTPGIRYRVTRVAGA